ncbi:probable LRR receptor-like serine/threonine-protein kinase RFK1 [Rosa rugosa]|uniref:probable LRR receptor-like serine/threonine-protein kinase RFK1 n=1 Tax=Rosa rugosa TaxID=74645 RepID=UPI002B40B4F8|nr:probable LRR receptor-like serine/threonine-protein kinase RFK1 [Rosa rugosa]XP_062000359.1 probable LRR receptor-like serine/threonine-protein kinase RFK1 [Rosa rugosa]XP_062009376.1 probable LRR receptor-like serine/threonine-protein kinase RFK1 [Rosa rugosa]XP_062016889.1 probable LRR receptor-like serine/threonine-protein kinase RFK1 [Rosa rugosa]
MLKNMTGLVKLILRNCNISGEIPPYLWTLQKLEMLDLSFNKLIGEIPTTISLKRLRFLFLTGNSLRGSVPDSIFIDGSNVLRTSKRKIKRPIKYINYRDYTRGDM